MIAVVQPSSSRFVALPLGQWSLLLAVCAVGSCILLYTVAVSRVSTTLLFCTIATVGALLCRRQQVVLGDPALQVTGYLWLVKLLLTFFLLHAGWLPDLDPESSTRWGYDPQRYYQQSQDLIDNNWIPGITGLNYFGILYYYGAIMALFGRNPQVPALVNCFITLLAVLYLINFCYEIRGRVTGKEWRVALVLLFPEIVWFDVLTARETLVGALLLLFLISAGRYLARTGRLRVGHVLLMCGIAVAAIAGVRTSMLLPLLAALMLMIVFVRQTRQRRVFGPILLTVAALIAIVFAPLIASGIGGEEFSAVDALRTSTTTEENTVATDEGTWWAEDSIGRLLLPDNLVEAILFVPPRMILYLIAPLPNVRLTVDGLVGGSWDAWQRLMVAGSALFNILAMPYVLASAAQAVANRRREPGALALHISYWLMAAAVAGGNLIIHERYRVMSSMLLWACAWLGAVSAPKSQIIKMATAWYAVLTLCALMVLVYKGL